MPGFRFKYSVRAMLLFHAVTAAVLYYAMLPTMRARRFARAIHTGHYNTAAKMVPGAFGDEGHTGFFDRDFDVYIEPISALQVWNGTRCVTVSKPWETGAVFTITRSNSSSWVVFPVGDIVNLEYFDELSLEGFDRGFGDIQLEGP